MVPKYRNTHFKLSSVSEEAKRSYYSTNHEPFYSSNPSHRRVRLVTDIELITGSLSVLSLNELLPSCSIVHCCFFCFFCDDWPAQGTPLVQAWTLVELPYICSYLKVVHFRPVPREVTRLRAEIAVSSRTGFYLVTLYQLTPVSTGILWCLTNLDNFRSVCCSMGRPWLLVLLTLLIQQDEVMLNQMPQTEKIYYVNPNLYDGWPCMGCGPYLNPEHTSTSNSPFQALETINIGSLVSFNYGGGGPWPPNYE